MKKRNLHIFTAYYPGSRFEVYMDNEIKYLSTEFSEVTIYPGLKNDEKRDIPANCKVVYLSDDPAFAVSSFKLVFLFPSIITRLLLSEIREHGIKKVWLNKSFIKKYLFHQLRIFHCLKGRINNKHDVYYSNWSVDASLTLALLKKKGLIHSFVMRAHRYDLYDEEFPTGFIPFRKFQQDHVKYIASISQDGIKYLNERFPDLKNKVVLHRLGTSDNGISVWKPENSIRIVSCSNIKKVKRLHLLAEALKFCNCKMEWHHFGDGELKDQITAIAETFPKEISYKIYGRIPSQDLFDFYRKNYISLFINVSASEGIPVSIMEAVSFGIPVLATDVGGTSEIISDMTGKLMDKNIQPRELAALIISENEKWADAQKREMIRKYWKENYSAEKCFPPFARMLSES